MAGTWIKFSTSLASQDRPFHSGITNDIIETGLATCNAESGYDLTTHPNESNAEGFSCAGSTEWRWFSTIFPIDVPVRPRADGGMRDYTIHAEGALSTSGVANVRAFLCDEGHPPPHPRLDPTAALADVTTYTDLTYNSTGWSTSSGMITGNDIPLRQWPTATISPTDAVSVRPTTWGAWLRLAHSTSVANTVKLRNLRVVEVP